MGRFARALAALVLAVGLAAACTADKKPAERALAAAEQAVAAVRTEGERYLPDQVKSLEQALAAGREKFADGQYEAVLATVQDLPARAREVATAIDARKEELGTSWTELSGTVPGAISSLKQRLRALARRRKLPAGVTADRVEAAKSALATLEQGWTDASRAFTSGDVADAVTRARAVRDAVAETLASIGLASRIGQATPPSATPRPPAGGSLSGTAGETQTGLAAYYSQKLHGRRTASGERFDNGAMTTAHQTLPFGTRVKITHLETGRSVIVRVNDRGPAQPGRIVDVTRAVAERLGFLRAGLAEVKLEVVEAAKRRSDRGK